MDWPTVGETAPVYCSTEAIVNQVGGASNRFIIWLTSSDELTHCIIMMYCREFSCYDTHTHKERERGGGRLYKTIQIHTKA